MTRIVMTMSIRTRGRIGIMIARTVSTRARERVHRRPHRARANAPRVRSRPITAKANAGDEEEENDEFAVRPAWESERNAANRRPIWETDIDAEYARVEKMKRDREAKRAAANAGAGLGFGRAKMLDDLNVDLSASLRRRGDEEDEDEEEEEDEGDEEDEEEEDGEDKLLGDGSLTSPADPMLRYVDKDGRVKGEPTALDLATTKKGDSKYNLRGWNYAPTRAEKGRWQREWEKAERAKAMRTPGYRPESSLSIKSKIKDQTFAPVKAFADLTDEEKAARRAADQAKYAKIKEDLFLTTAGMAGSGAVAAFAVGGTNMGYSWLLGAAGAIAYVRLLSGKAESANVQGGPPSILVPVILFMALNRWNALASQDVGVTLSPIPMLLAFFTYKPASVLQAFKDVLENSEDEEETA